jgi:hypothetical protein
MEGAVIKCSVHPDVLVTWNAKVRMGKGGEGGEAPHTCLLFDTFIPSE